MAGANDTDESNHVVDIPSTSTALPSQSEKARVLEQPPLIDFDEEPVKTEKVIDNDSDDVKSSAIDRSGSARTSKSPAPKLVAHQQSHRRSELELEQWAQQYFGVERLSAEIARQTRSRREQLHRIRTGQEHHIDVLTQSKV